MTPICLHIIRQSAVFRHRQRVTVLRLITSLRKVIQASLLSVRGLEGEPRKEYKRLRGAEVGGEID
jgi:hypothetical protein